jgi:FkbM family methyltransferase
MLAQLQELGARIEAVERLSRGGKGVYVGNGRVLLQARIREATFAFLLHADDRLLLPTFFANGAYEAELTEFFLQNVKRGDHCLDLGANFGYYTCLMARLAANGRTIGVEPDRPVFELLRDNIFINDLQDIGIPVEAAVGAVAGTLQLHRRVTRSGNTSIARMPIEFTTLFAEPESPSFEAACVTVDTLLPRLDGRVDFIKIDVEGAEPSVFRGVSGTLAANPGVKIVMEWSPGQMQAAGFDPPTFTRDLQQMGLDIIGVIAWPGVVEPISWDALLDQKYLSGILLSVNHAPTS